MGKMKNRLKWGMLVETTPLAIRRQLFPKPRKGICLGSRWGNFSIVVVCEGQVTPSKYHPSFWRSRKSR